MAPLSPSVPFEQAFDLLFQEHVLVLQEHVRKVNELAAQIYARGQAGHMSNRAATAQLFKLEPLSTRALQLLDSVAKTRDIGTPTKRHMPIEAHGSIDSPILLERSTKKRKIAHAGDAGNDGPDATTEQSRTSVSPPATMRVGSMAAPEASNIEYDDITREVEQRLQLNRSRRARRLDPDSGPRATEDSTQKEKRKRISTGSNSSPARVALAGAIQASKRRKRDAELQETRQKNYEFRRRSQEFFTKAADVENKRPGSSKGSSRRFGPAGTVGGRAAHTARTKAPLKQRE